GRVTFLPVQESNQRTRRWDASRCGEAASSPCAPRESGVGAQLAMLRHVRLFASDSLRCSARFTAGQKLKSRKAKAGSQATVTQTGPLLRIGFERGGASTTGPPAELTCAVPPPWPAAR